MTLAFPCPLMSEILLTKSLRSEGSMGQLVAWQSVEVRVLTPSHESFSKCVNSSKGWSRALQVHPTKHRHEIMHLTHIRLVITAQELRRPAPIHVGILIEAG